MLKLVTLLLYWIRKKIYFPNSVLKRNKAIRQYYRLKEQIKKDLF